jgi:hypothetical protein
VTQLLVDPLTPAIWTPTYFTAVIKNQGVMTAFRWFGNEVYVRPAGWPPPSSNSDHLGGVGTYLNYAFLKPGGNPPDSSEWKVDQLGPGQSITLTTAITFTTELGNLNVYAQPDVYFDGDEAHYAKAYGSDPEGYGIPPYPEEQNVLAFSQPIYVPPTYLMDAPPVITKTAPPGTQATFAVRITNRGNMTDTYTVALSSTTYPTWTVNILPPTSMQVLPGKIHTVTVQVNVPRGIPEGIMDQTILTVQSGHVPSRNVVLNTIVQKIRLYLPILMKKK